MAQEAESKSTKKNEKDITAFDVESYIQERWNSQRNHFSKSSRNNQKWFNFCQITIIVLSGLSVTILTIDMDVKLIKIICSILSLLVIIVSGIDKLKQYNAEWVSDRRATEKLKSEICKYKFGVAPYTVPEKPEEKKPEADKPKDEGGEKKEESGKGKDESTISERTKFLLERLNTLAEKCEDGGIRSSYKEIKAELANYVAGTKDYADKEGKISSKDKNFVARLNSIMDEYVKIVEEQNIYSRIKNEICDFYTDKGAYKVEEKAKPKPAPKYVITENDRLFVTRVEEIIAKDVEEFEQAKSKLAEIDAQIDKLLESKGGGKK
ncbi:MAG: DUF4231 domain-containing protein [Bacteroidales bacterium]|nr:DUF4231 domain-containing protein [Bacteroidales bacterium]